KGEKIMELLSCEAVKKLVEEGIPESGVEVKDLTGTSDHFHIRVTSPAFEGKSLLDQHKMVQKSLGRYLGQEIHAVEIKTITG
ncbi:MAG: BolA family protein, partial [Planctomycetota bacterium]|nr:BolA family protein [Planctomycetota bacterium]